MLRLFNKDWYASKCVWCARIFEPAPILISSSAAFGGGGGGTNYFLTLHNDNAGNIILKAKLLDSILFNFSNTN